MAKFVTVARVLGDGPFAEIGQPRVVAEAPDGALIAVAGDLGDRPQWHGRDVAARSRPLGWWPCGIYRRADLRCELLFTTRWQANSIAFHPRLPVAAVGTGSYDGGYQYSGELLLVDLVSGRVVSALDQDRMVRAVSWRDDHVMAIVLAPFSDVDEETLGTDALAVAVRRDSWHPPKTRMIRLAGTTETPLATVKEPDLAAARRAVESICADHGSRWNPRRQVWAVHGLSDGRVLAALEGVAPKCWPATGTEADWTRPADGTGCQITVAPDERSAVTNTQPPWRPKRAASQVERVSLPDGTPTADIDVDFPAVMVGRRDGWLALRNADRGRSARDVTLVAPRGAIGARLRIGGYDLFNHFFDIRDAPELLFLQGSPSEPWRDKWVVAVDTKRASVRRLFPLEWDTRRNGRLFGGPGAFVDDEKGPAILHAGALHDGSGLVPGNAFVARRSYPDGDLAWVFTADYQVTAIDTRDQVVFACLNSGEFVVLRSRDGSVLGRQQVTVDGHRVVPLSVATAGRNRVLIGTLDGRLLDCAVALPGT